MTKPPTRRVAAVALASATALALSGCAGAATTAEDDTITIGYLPSWTDAVNNAFLLQNQFEKLGYRVELETLTEPGILYTALAEGDIDLYPSAWPDISQASYMEQYGDRLEDLGTYYEAAHGTLAVPAHVDIDEIEDLHGQADRFDGKIYTIEAGSGTAAMAAESLFPAYGLGDEYDLVSSSTAAMLAALEDAVKREEDIVVTLWRPFWAYEAYGLKDLEDPLEGMGATEGLHFLGNAGFSERFPEAAELLGQIVLDDEQYGALENTVVNEYGDGREAEAIDAWLGEHAADLGWVIE